MALHGPPLGAPFAALQLQGSLKNVPWFIYAFGALGAATTLTSATALLGIRLRSPGCMSSHIFFMCLLLTGQACAAVAFFMDKGWQKRLPEIDEKLKEFLAARLQVRARHGSLPAALKPAWCKPAAGRRDFVVEGDIPAHAGLN
jgi:hypothetical protein